MTMGACAAVAAFFLLSLLLLLPMLRAGYIVDDTYIHLQFARNLATGGGWCFNPGEPVYGFTGPIYPALLAGLHAAAGIGLEKAVRFAAVSSILATLFLLVFIGRSLLSGRTATAVLLLAFATDPWILRWAASGMETVPTLPFLLGSTALLLGPSPGWKRIFLAGACAGCGALSRPESILFVLVAAASLLLPGAGERAARAIRRSAAYSSGAAAMLLPWHLFAWRGLGRVLPTTFTAKGGSFPPSIELVLGSLERTAAGFGPRLIDIGLLIGLLAVICITCLNKTGYTKHIKQWFNEIPGNPVYLRRQIILWNIAWTALLPLFYISRGAIPLSRYLVPAFPYLTLSCLLVIDLYGRCRAASAAGGKKGDRGSSGSLEKGGSPGRAARGRGIAAGFGAAVISINLVILYQVVFPHVRAFSDDYREAVLDTGRWLAANTPEDAVVATRDIGGIGYFSERRICDLGGLVTPGMLTLRDGMDLDDIVAAGVFPCSPSPGYLVHAVPHTSPPAIASQGSPVRCILLRSNTIRQQGLSFSEPTAYRLYRLDPSEEG